ncbi:MAG: efflux RND transporter periplasmic adaptor subunit [Cellulosilyticum sp.]|nr:efflux RND transporter periplasmic adaptor subunit [Cellulosilyticum sp.]
MKARKYLISGISLAVLASSLATGCGSTEAVSDAVSSQEQVVSTSVETLTLVEDTIQSYKTLSASIVAKNEVAVIPKVGGTVSKVHVKVGDKVKAGDVLFEIDSRDIEIQVKSAQSSVTSSQATISSAQAGLDAAEAGLNAAKANYNMNTGSNLDNQLSSQKANVENLERQYNDLLRDLESNKALLEVGAVSQNTIDNMETQIATAKSNLDQAKNQLKTLEEQTIEETKRASEASVQQAEASVSQATASIAQAEASAAQAQTSLENAQQQLSYTKVVAEIDGIISNCTVTEGSTVGAGSVALSLIDIDKVKIAFNITGDLVNTIQAGNTVYTYIDAVSDEPFEGVVSTVAPAADSKTGLYPVEIEISNPKHLLKPGMFATSKLVLSENPSALSVPIGAVIDKGETKYVYTVDADNIAHKIAVETGLENETHIEIVSGLNANDVIVIKGQDYLSEGSLVNIVAAN